MKREKKAADGETSGQEDGDSSLKGEEKNEGAFEPKRNIKLDKKGRKKESKAGRNVYS